MGKEKTQFKPGQSGNPGGRPKGKSKVAQLRSLLEPSVPDLVAKAIEMAMAGDVAALRLCLERVLPPLKAMDSPVQIEGLSGSLGLSEQGGTVINAMANGSISPTEAATLLKALADQAKIVEVEELDKRITALEECSR
ncbi:MAG: DUF5681 domain-containing protein [Candidatus Sedimenticola sp. (ex Thyasira tokunagai)]